MQYPKKPPALPRHTHAVYGYADASFDLGPLVYKSLKKELSILSIRPWKPVVLCFYFCCSSFLFLLFLVSIFVVPRFYSCRLHFLVYCLCVSNTALSVFHPAQSQSAFSRLKTLPDPSECDTAWHGAQTLPA